MNEEPMVLSDELKRSGDTRWLTRSEGGVVPSGAILMFDTACPAGWTRFTALDNKFPRGAATYGGTGGADTHTHTGPSHTHSGPSHTHSGPNHSHAPGATTYVMIGSDFLVWLSNNSGNAGTGATGADGTGATGADGTGATGSTSNVPSYVDVVWCKKN